jgi:hypothetical protein
VEIVEFTHTNSVLRLFNGEIYNFNLKYYTITNKKAHK